MRALDNGEHYVMARDVREGMLVDFGDLYRSFGEPVPDWCEYEYGTVTDVLAEDVVSIDAIGTGFSVSRETPIIVADTLPVGYVPVDWRDGHDVYGVLDD